MHIRILNLVYERGHRGLINFWSIECDTEFSICKVMNILIFSGIINGKKVSAMALRLDLRVWFYT